MTGASVSFTATCSDNVACASVTFYVDNVSKGTDSTFPYALPTFDSTALTDGTHTLKVTALDTSGNAATPITENITVSNTVGSASAYISPTGTDSGTCTVGSPCKSINYAETKVTGDQIIQAAGGMYPMQTISNANTATSGHPITIQPDTSGTAAQFGPSTTMSTSSVTFFDSTTPASFTVTDAAAAALWVISGSQIFQVNHVPVYCSGRSGATFTGCFAQPGAGCTSGSAATLCTVTAGQPVYEEGIRVSSGANNLYFKGLTVGQIVIEKLAAGSPIDGITLDNITGRALYVQGNVTNTLVENSNFTLGTVNFKSTITGDGSGHNPVGVTVRDTVFKHTTRVTSATHNECLQITAGSSILLDRVKMDDCSATADLAIANDLGATSNVTVQNSWFGKIGDAAAALQVSNNITNSTIQYNTMLKGLTINNACSSCGNVFRANYGTAIGCLSGDTYDKNVMQSGSCTGDNASTGHAPQVVASTDPFDLHLTSCTDVQDKGDLSSYPTVDVDSVARYLGSGPDVGASECG